MKKIIFAIVAMLTASSYALAEEITILQCKCNSIINKDYYFKDGKWIDGAKNDIIFRDKIFSKLNTDKPIIKSITPKNKYSDEQAVEFEGTVIHRVDSIIMIKWTNNFNKIWIATINLKYKTAVVTENYDGVTSFGVNVETLNCK